MTTFTSDDREEEYKKILAKGTIEMNQQLQNILQNIFARLNALENKITELQKIQDDLLSR
jgi:hypothetical protein